MVSSTCQDDYFYYWYKVCFFCLFFLFVFLSRPSAALMSLSSTQVLVDHWGTFCAGGYPNVHFRFSYQVAVVGFEPPTF